MLQPKRILSIDVIVLIKEGFFDLNVLPEFPVRVVHDPDMARSNPVFGEAFTPGIHT
jgi:hypothetical protein